MNLSRDKRDRVAELRREIAAITAETPEQRAARRAHAKALRDALKDSQVQGKRQPRQRDPGYLAYLRRLSCVACWAQGIPSGAPIEAAHIRFSDARLGRINSGMQTKPSDCWATPLCHHHHQHDQHKRQERAFWTGLGVEPGALSMALYAAYLAGEDGYAVIEAHVPEPEESRTPPTASPKSRDTQK